MSFQVLSVIHYAIDCDYGLFLEHRYPEEDLKPGTFKVIGSSMHFHPQDLKIGGRMLVRFMDHQILRELWLECESLKIHPLTLRPGAVPIPETK